MFEIGRSFSLPDISARYNLYSAGLLSAISNPKRDWGLIAFNIHSLNTLLTSRYTIPVSDELYKKRTFIQQIRKCNHCFEKKQKTVTDDEGNSSKEYYEIPTEIPVNEIEILEEQLDNFTLLLVNFNRKSRQVPQTTRRYWNCPKCSNANLLSETPKSDRRFGSNATFGVIYEQPKYSLIARRNIDKMSMKWATDYMREIDVGLMAYQKAYFDEHGKDMENPISSFSHEEKK